MENAAALLVCLVLAGLGLFQALLIGGAPLGRFAWGGGHEVLPRGFRVGSTISLLLYAAFAWIALERVGVVDLSAETRAIRTAAWVLTGYFALGVIMNAASRSRPERFVMTPVALLLAVLFGIVAAAG